MRIAFRWLIRAFAGFLPAAEVIYLWDFILAYDSLGMRVRFSAKSNENRHFTPVRRWRLHSTPRLLARRADGECDWSHFDWFVDAQSPAGDGSCLGGKLKNIVTTIYSTHDIYFSIIKLYLFYASLYAFVLLKGPIFCNDKVVIDTITSSFELKLINPGCILRNTFVKVQNIGEQ